MINKVDGFVISLDRTKNMLCYEERLRGCWFGEAPQVNTTHSTTVLPQHAGDVQCRSTLPFRSHLRIKGKEACRIMYYI